MDFVLWTCGGDYQWTYFVDAETEVPLLCCLDVFLFITNIKQTMKGNIKIILPNKHLSLLSGLVHPRILQPSEEELQQQETRKGRSQDHVMDTRAVTGADKFISQILKALGLAGQITDGLRCAPPKGC